MECDKLCNNELNKVADHRWQRRGGIGHTKKCVRYSERTLARGFDCFPELMVNANADKWMDGNAACALPFCLYVQQGGAAEWTAGTARFYRCYHRLNGEISGMRRKYDDTQRENAPTFEKWRCGERQPSYLLFSILFLISFFFSFLFFFQPYFIFRERDNRPCFLSVFLFNNVNP